MEQEIDRWALAPFLDFLPAWLCLQLRIFAHSTTRTTLPRLLEQRENCEARCTVLAKELQASDAELIKLRRQLKGSGMLVRQCWLGYSMTLRGCHAAAS